MRQVKWTAKPARARNLVRALGALLLGTATLAPARAQVTPPDPATKAAMEKRTAARSLLSSSLARIAANNSDTAALFDAGRASIDLEDYRAALGFLVRAEQARPRDGTIKAALGSAMVHMENPTRALDYFGEAQLMGAPERLFLADRGLARDLLGQQDAAQRDYQLALSIAPNDELTRRYALSLGISGDADRGIAMLTPQLRAQDRGAWRLRAMILAMNGRDKEATEIVNATMPPAMAQNITPYLLQMDRLNPAQQAAAAHFGRFPSQPGAKRGPVQVAAATPPSQPPAARRKRPGASDSGRPVSSTTPAPAAVTRKPDTTAVAARPAATAGAQPAPAPAGDRAPALRSPFRETIRPLSEASAPVADAPAGVPAAATPAPAGRTGDADKGSIGPGFSIADVGRPAASAPAAATATPAPPAAASLASLAEIVGSIEIPAEELNRPAGAVGADTLAMLLEDKRRAEAAEAAKREKEEAAAKAKAEADAKAKEEAAKKKANPARIWVQIATGSNLKALGFDYNRFAKRNAALFKGKSGATAEWGQTRRLLVGPFPNRKSAQDWLGDYKKAEGDGFLFDSEAGEIVEPLK
ncbi:SPOR domain-containing protein [Sphingopyxis sp. PAMC25046]|uniref:SPOR domain-containing protein n=1 Tax=Sphingopyxis sp. PAMC25046 TaxID=2565556 RepID=UPI00109E112E|nr:SPOR domain-containing protein [Sphingopyxis sp. PAMC25046]QCB54134.1 SPOR domain-containing protein [Sphingopyxis sp. PAMC25046]